MPLSRQAVAILTEQRTVSGDGKYVFPHVRRVNRHMSNGSMNAALARLFYTSTEQTPHGFRTTAATLLRDELKFDSELVERQLAHKSGDATAAAYDRSQRLTERRDMMQRYADYLEELKTVTP